MFISSGLSLLLVDGSLDNIPQLRPIKECAGVFEDALGSIVEDLTHEET